jgi:hypothetical protein
MWRLSSVVKRERNTVTAAAKKLSYQFRLNQHVSLHQRSLSSAAAASGSSSPDVAVQLDYYMSLQFAGVACVLVNGKNYFSFVYVLTTRLVCTPSDRRTSMHAMSDELPINVCSNR